MPINRLQLKANKTVKEFTESVRQGIPSAVFGVPDSFKACLLSEIQSPVFLVVKDNITAGYFKSQIEKYSSKKVGVIPPKDEILLTARGFSKDTVHERIKSIFSARDSQVIIATIESAMQTFPSHLQSLTLIKGQEYELNNQVKRLVIFPSLCRNQV